MRTVLGKRIEPSLLWVRTIIKEEKLGRKGAEKGMRRVPIVAQQVKNLT